MGELRKEIKIIREARGVRMRPDVAPEVSPWAKDGGAHNPLLNPARGGGAGTGDGDALGPLAAAYLSKPDLDQFTRDAIYMLHQAPAPSASAIAARAPRVSHAARRGCRRCCRCAAR